MRAHHNRHTCGCTSSSLDGFAQNVTGLTLAEAVGVLGKGARKEHVHVSTPPDWDTYREAVNAKLLTVALAADPAWSADSVLDRQDGQFLARVIHGRGGLTAIRDALTTAGAQLLEAD